MATITSNYDGDYAKSLAVPSPATNHLAVVNADELILEERACASVFVPIHVHVRSLFE
jgi:hypothetical protein